MTAVQRVTQGFVAPGFEPVAEAFAATLDGQPVVDLWGGLADCAARLPWREDTIQTIFSGTKGLVALCIAMLVDRGQLRLDDPVSAH